MSTVAPPFEKEHAFQAPHNRPIERQRGKWGMWLFIASEATLFALLFFSYAYLGTSNEEWPTHEDPALKFALILLGILLVSSAVLYWGERAIKKGALGQLKASLATTLLLGVAFLIVQYFEYVHHLKHLTPWENAYGSIFYTITSFHLAHLLLGFCMLLFVFARSLAGHFSKERHLAVENVALYWHFVDLVWVFVVFTLYITPRFYA